MVEAWDLAAYELRDRSPLFRGKLKPSTTKSGRLTAGFTNWYMTSKSLVTKHHAIRTVITKLLSFPISLHCWMKAAIIGTYNSGSSVLSQIVERMGFDIGRPLWGKHYESLSMKVLLAAWWAPPKLSATTRIDDRIPYFNTWGELYEGKSGNACLKHPLLCLSGSDLDAAWGSSYRAIRAYRPLEDSITRLKKRKWFEGQEHRIQTHLFNESEAYFSNKEHLKINYDNLLEQPKIEVIRIAEYLKIPYSDSLIDYASACVKSPK